MTSQYPAHITRPARTADYIKFRKQVNVMKNRTTNPCPNAIPKIDGSNPFRYSKTGESTSLALAVLSKASKRKDGHAYGLYELTGANVTNEHLFVERAEAIEAFDEIYDAVDLPIKDAYFDEAGIVLKGNSYRNTVTGYENKFPNARLTDQQRMYYAMLDVAIERYISRGTKADIVNAAQYAELRNNIAVSSNVKMANDRDIAAYFVKHKIEKQKATMPKHCDFKYEIPALLSKDETVVLEGIVLDAVKKTASAEVAKFAESRQIWLDTKDPKKSSNTNSKSGS